MTTAPSPPMTGPLADSAQALIDSRLDTIERMLLGQVARADRLAIVREVEAQIYDHLAERNPDDTDRDAVIAALARLDPPEAFLPDEAGTVARIRPAARSQPGPSAAPGVLAKRSPEPGTTAARVGGILGLVSLALWIPLAVSLYMIFKEHSNLFFYLLIPFSLTFDSTSLLAVIFSSYARLKSPMAVVGFVAGLISLAPAMEATGLVLIELISG